MGSGARRRETRIWGIFTPETGSRRTRPSRTATGNQLHKGAEPNRTTRTEEVEAGAGVRPGVGAMVEVEPHPLIRTPRKASRRRRGGPRRTSQT